MHRAGGLLTTRLAITVVLAVLLLGFTTRRAAPRDDRTGSAGWDREGAARYLDERMQVWFANGKKLRTGQTETVCISCHTTPRTRWPDRPSGGRCAWLLSRPRR